MNSVEPQLRTQYWNDLKARKAFQEFIVTIHNLDFTKWQAAGFWDDDYIPFTYFEGEKIVSSACIYTMPAIVNGRKTKVAQVSGVGTLPEYRRRGLNRRLTEVALDWAFQEHEFVFLFSDVEAIPFYQKCGFRPVNDYAEVTKLPATRPRAGLRKREIVVDRRDQTLKLLYELACEREPISDAFSNSNPKLLMFHALYSLREHIYFIEELRVVIFLKREPGRTIVFDVLARKLPSFDELYPYLATGSAEEFEFRFFTDKLNVPQTRFKQLLGNDVHVMGPVSLREKIVFPYTLKA
ncbi:MAG: GNAT family N-acetyltransferase [Bdellovibrionota bacterium]